MVAGKIHFQLASIHVYQVSIWLESVEVVANKFSNYESGRTEELTRKVHAEHHEFCRDTKTIGFALASLPIAAASFASAIVSNSWQLRIELIISMPGSPACDLALSAATQFPPSRHSLQRTPGATKHTPLSPISLQHQQQRTGLLSPRRYTISSDRSGGTRSGHSVPATPSAPTPATPTPASPTVTADGKFQANGWTPRLRSPTVTGGNAHQLPSPHIVSRPSTFSYRAAGQQHTHQPNKLSPPAPLDTAAAAAATSLGAKSVPPTAGPLSSVSEAGNEHSFPQSPAVKLPSDYSSIRAMRKRYDILQSIPTQTLSCTVSIQMHPSLSAALPSRHKDAFKIDLTKRA
ncbi:Golgi membrane exchange factor (Ric1p-Rgp1p) subunit [Dipsacomyces acuminosporus]|nr:Golgi membrane exchange factor (Ric1p-Rgp1p) subunit [Dipsacomyces acuminosporus]